MNVNYVFINILQPYTRNECMCVCVFYITEFSTLAPAEKVCKHHFDEAI